MIDVTFTTPMTYNLFDLDLVGCVLTHDIPLSTPSEEPVRSVYSFMVFVAESGLRIKDDFNGVSFKFSVIDQAQYEVELAEQRLEDIKAYFKGEKNEHNAS